MQQYNKYLYALYLNVYINYIQLLTIHLFTAWWLYVGNFKKRLIVEFITIMLYVVIK